MLMWKKIPRNFSPSVHNIDILSASSFFKFKCIYLDLDWYLSETNFYAHVINNSGYSMQWLLFLLDSCEKHFSLNTAQRVDARCDHYYLNIMFRWQ